jgi:hypothetical protein
MEDVIGTDDRVQVNNWFSNTGYQVDSIATTDATLAAEKVDQLVNAMAAFDAQAGAGAVTPQDVQDQLAPVLVETWLKV